MLTQVEVRTTQGDLLILPLDDVSAGLILEQIEGLDPVKATLVSSSFARLDGEQYHSSRRETRNLKFRLGLEPDYIVDSVQDLRQRLYTFFMPKSEVILTFRDSNNSSVVIRGRVETFETPFFTKEPAVDISIICFDPDFIDNTQILLSSGTVATEVETLIDYEGSVDSGLVFILNADRAISEFTIYQRSSGGLLKQLDFSAPLIAGDQLIINTVPGIKGAWRTRSGTQSSVLYGISPQSSWITLTPGDNYLRVYATGVAIPFNISYNRRYGGL
jgi:hypothetical protein